MDYLDTAFFDQYREPKQNHVCSLYRNKDEQFASVIPFFIHGMSCKEKCVYIVDENTRIEVLDEFTKRTDRKMHADFGKIIFLTKADAYLKGGYFDPDRMINLLRSEEEKALNGGHNGIRVTGEMTWVLTRLPGVERFLEYEAKLNYYFPGSKARAICQYNENKFSSEILIDVIYTHPVVGFYGTLYENPYYMSPEIFFARKKESSINMYEKVRDNIIMRGKT